MTVHRLRACLLDDGAYEAIDGATKNVLEQTGVEVQHEHALELLARAGAQVEGLRARIPWDLVREAISGAAEGASIRSRADGESLILDTGHTYFGTGSDCLYLLGPGTRDRRKVELADVEAFAALQQKLPNIDFVMSMAHPAELPSSIQDAAQFAAMLRGTSKPIMMVPSDAVVLPVMKEMAGEAGAEDSWGVYAMPSPPLVHGFEAVDKLMRCAELGIPITYASAPFPGATAPASAVASIVVANAEVLSGLVINQLAAVGAPFIYGFSQGTFNLQTAHACYATPEALIDQQACTELARYYGLPSFGWGGTSDSPLLDEQWTLEAAYCLMSSALARPTLVHDVGYIASGTSSSFESIVLMDELVRYVRKLAEGLTIDDDSLAVDQIASAGPGGSHLSTKYTRRHYRGFFQPKLLSEESFASWASAGAKTLLERTAERTQDLLSVERSYCLEPEVLVRLDSLVERTRSLREGAAAAGRL